MIAALLLATALAAMTPLDAERAFAADTQALGQWTAFRKWAASEAIMFTPKPINAQAFLKDAKDTPKAVRWWPTASYLSCDGKVAVNTGGWEQPDGTVGYFTTVWERQPNGDWRWLIDAGAPLKVRRAEPKRPIVRRATCPKELMIPRHVSAPPSNVGIAVGAGDSPDVSLSWYWTTWRDGADRRLVMDLWNGQHSELVIDDRIGAPFVE